MNKVVLHRAFIPAKSSGRDPESAVTVGAGALWMDVYDAVTTKGGRYVQGGGCATVGVAGLIQGGGFGSFSKMYGTAASSLLEAQIVTADGFIRTANPHVNADLFWALKGGGGGTFGVVTSVTLKTHALPLIFGDVSISIRAASDAAFRKLIGSFLDFYSKELFNYHWGESVTFHHDRTLEVNMVFADLTKEAAAAPWQRFISSVTDIPDIAVTKKFFIEALPARRWWDAEYLQKFSPGSVYVDSRPNAPRSHAWWQGDQGQVGEFIHGYESSWLPASLLETKARLVEALFASARHWSVSLHFNKGLAGGRPEVIQSAKSGAMNPAVAEAFALAIVSGGAQPKYHQGHPISSDRRLASIDAQRIRYAMAELRNLAPDSGSYVSESNYFEQSWQHSFWASHYARLKSIKNSVDPEGLFFVRHVVGSELWSDDGFTPLA